MKPTTELPEQRSGSRTKTVADVTGGDHVLEETASGVAEVAKVHDPDAASAGDEKKTCGASMKHGVKESDCSLTAYVSEATETGEYLV